MHKWKDETSYSQGAKRRIPSIVALGLPGNVKLIVHRLIHVPELWFFSLRWSGHTLFKDVELVARNLEQAKVEAMQTSSCILLRLAADFQRVAKVLDND